jgi:hypothetical protein
MEKVEKTKKIKYLTLIDDSQIKKGSSNGSRSQTLLFIDIQKVWYKLIIHSESYDSQSHIRLYSSSDRNQWLLIKSENPKRDYNIDISYKDDFSTQSFKPIIDDYKKFLTKLIKATYE